MDRPTRRWLPAVVFALLLLVVSLFPAPETGSPTPTLLGIAADKWVHAASYGALTLLLAWARDSRAVATVALVAAVAVGYGGGIELLQTLVPSRSASIADILANTVGVVGSGSAWLVARAVPPIRASRRSEQ